MPLRPVPPRPPRAAATAVVVAALAAALPALAAAPAGAAVPTVRAPEIVTPLPPATGLASVVPAAGDGLVAWAVPGPPPAGGRERPVALWTLQGGVPVVATTVPVRGRPLALELGTERGGAPVAVLQTTEDAEDAPVVTRLVRLDTGAAGACRSAGVGASSTGWRWTAGASTTSWARSGPAPAPAAPSGARR